MMMAGNKKKPVTLIMDMMGKSEKAPAQDGAELDSEPGLDAAAEEMLAAIEAKDPAALKAAVRSMVQMCMDEYEASEPAE